MMPEDWTRLSPEDVATTPTESGRGLFYSPSPYNVPIAFRVLALPAGNRVIEFRYLDDNEPAILANPENRIAVALGKNSKRVFRVIVEGEEFQRSGPAVIRDILNALFNLRANNPRALDNLEATSTAVSRLGERLLQGT